MGRRPSVTGRDMARRYPNAAPERMMLAGSRQRPECRCGSDVAPAMKHLLIDVCVNRRSGPAGRIIAKSGDALEVLEGTVPALLDDQREHFIVLYMNHKHRVIGVLPLTNGTISSTLVDPKLLLQPAVLLSASAVIIAHNHPSGDPTPSADDFALTSRLKQVAATLSVKLLDHLVVGDRQGGGSGNHRYVSMMDEGTFDSL